jgi:hypothetical protein
MSEPRFFIGWEGRTGPGLGWFLALLAAAGLALMGGLALALARSGADHAPRGFGGPPLSGLEEGPAALEGVLTAQPTPLLHLADGRTVLLAGEGKLGPPGDATALHGQRVAAAGYLTHRGSIAMLNLAEPPQALGAGAPPMPVPLGRWRLSGEICDGKCAAGIMRPGTGISHRACAIFCVAGGVPAVFVSAAPLAGEHFLVLPPAPASPRP